MEQPVEGASKNTQRPLLTISLQLLSCLKCRGRMVKHSFLFWKSRIQMSARKQVTLTVFMGVSSGPSR
jgi:hypothetical protein